VGGWGVRACYSGTSRMPLSHGLRWVLRQTDPTMSDDSASKTGVLLLRLAVPSIMLLGTPLIAFDGLLPVRMGWGKEFVPLGPGKHTVTCQDQVLRGLKTGVGKFDFELPEGVVLKLRWRAPLLASGSWLLEEPRPKRGVVGPPGTVSTGLGWSGAPRLAGVAEATG
jgi:hypothetical protein